MVSVPEGLPLAVSIAVAFSLDTMKHNHILMKNVGVLERLASVYEICSGKTSTLTEGKMQVTHFVTQQQHYQNKAHNYFSKCDISP